MMGREDIAQISPLKTVQYHAPHTLMHLRTLNPSHISAICPRDFPESSPEFPCGHSKFARSIMENRILMVPYTWLVVLTACLLKAGKCTVSFAAKYPAI